MYAYRPLSLRSLGRMLEHGMLGQTARYERFMADMAHVIASGKHIDPDRTDRFRKQVDDVFRNPFGKKPAQPMTRKEIEAYIVRRLTGEGNEK